MVVSGPLSEEPGWRGTAYPRMRASMNRFQVGLVLGVIWAVWHLPLFFIDGTPRTTWAWPPRRPALRRLHRPDGHAHRLRLRARRSRRVDGRALLGQHDDGPAGRQDPGDPGPDHRHPAARDGAPAGRQPPEPPGEQARRVRPVQRDASAARSPPPPRSPRSGPDRHRAPGRAPSGRRSPRVTARRPTPVTSRRRRPTAPAGTADSGR
ncbi:CPBP family intramembrane glutamic endopeptidase [Streptomyces sp. M19]